MPLISDSDLQSLFREISVVHRCPLVLSVIFLVDPLAATPVKTNQYKTAPRRLPCTKRRVRRRSATGGSDSDTFEDGGFFGSDGSENVLSSFVASGCVLKSDFN